VPDEASVSALYAHRLGAPRCTRKAISPGDVLRARTDSGTDRRAGDLIVIVSIVEIEVGSGFILTVHDGRTLAGPREVSLDWFTWDDTYELVER